MSFKFRKVFLFFSLSLVLALPSYAQEEFVSVTTIARSNFVLTRVTSGFARSNPWEFANGDQFLREPNTDAGPPIVPGRTIFYDRSDEFAITGTRYGVVAQEIRVDEPEDVEIWDGDTFCGDASVVFVNEFIENANEEQAVREDGIQCD